MPIRKYHLRLQREITSYVAQCVVEWVKVPVQNFPLTWCLARKVESDKRSPGENLSALNTTTCEVPKRALASTQQVKGVNSGEGLMVVEARPVSGVRAKKAIPSRDSPTVSRGDNDKSLTTEAISGTKKSIKTRGKGSKTRRSADRARIAHEMYVLWRPMALALLGKKLQNSRRDWDTPNARRIEDLLRRDVETDPRPREYFDRVVSAANRGFIRVARGWELTTNGMSRANCPLHLFELPDQRLPSGYTPITQEARVVANPAPRGVPERGRGQRNRGSRPRGTR